ncbi:hypothetical protein DFJ77DRAFT_449318 [Powellomyces hirtus]|nr:hypothetical protein DFJ77DRAFT_449318 [Powellomyces hirtus]
MVDPQAQSPAASSAADQPGQQPSSPGAKWTTISSKPRNAQKWGRGRGRPARGRGAPATRGGLRLDAASSRHDHSSHGESSVSKTSTSAPKPRGRDPVPKAERKASISSAHSADDSDSGASSGNESDRSPSPPPAVPLTFWTPMVFLCPMPDCPPATEPTTNPTVAIDHLRSAHNIEVKNAHHVLPYLDKYIEHWAKHISEKGVENVAHKSDVETADGKPLYLLGHESDLEDKVFREKLQREKLNHMLKIQEKERLEDSTISRKCLFCKVLCANRTLLFKHMFSEHGFNIGLPDNLVEVSDFLETLQKKLAGLQCLYCEKIFKTSAVLRKHMRKKKHFKINPRNRGYDRFYIINYLEPGKNWEAFENEKYESDEDRREEEWEDWNEDDSVEDSTMCLFDENVFPTADAAYEHMKEAHAFDLRKIREDQGLDFYESIKLINFIRKQTSLCSCYACAKTFDGIEQMTAHMETEKHFTQLPNKDADLWKDPQYLFPCYENDPLLMFDVADDEEGDDESDIDIAEAEAELRRVAIAERTKATEQDLRNATVGDSEALDGEESPCESDVIVLGVSEVTVPSPKSVNSTNAAESPNKPETTEVAASQ